jgi:hypothetical protein
MKNHAKINRGFEVETCVHLPRNEFGDADVDAADYHCFDCATKEQALRLAKRLLPNDKFGSVTITEFEVVDGYKEFTADPEYVDNL